jgi:hypothetical protein
MNYPNDEKETTCVYDYLSKEWTVYTCVPSHITRLRKIAEPYWKEEAKSENGSMRIVAGKWKLRKSQVRFAKVIEAMSS